MPAPKTQPKRAKPKIFWPWGVLLFVALLFLDPYTKWLVRASYAVGESHALFPGVWITYVQNTGMLWSLFHGPSANAAFVWISIILFGVLVYLFDKFKTPLEKICYVLILVGLWGNLLDRVNVGFVVDFIDLHWWPVFNVADSCLSIAIVLFLLQSLRK